MIVSVLAFSFLAALSVGLIGALVSDALSPPEPEEDRDFDSLREEALSTDGALGFALGLTPGEAASLLDETEFDDEFAEAEAILRDAPFVEPEDIDPFEDSGTPDDDVFRAGDGVLGYDTLLGGDDIISTANTGSENSQFLVFAGSGDNIILGAPNDLTQTSGTPGIGDKDVIFGDLGDDLISGGDGDDQLFGEAGNDVILAGDGDDKLNEVGPGTDFIYAGDGNDSVFRDPEPAEVVTGLDVVDLGDGDDLLGLRLGTTLVSLGAGADDLNIINFLEDRDDDPIAVVTDFVPGEDEIVLGAFATDPNAVAGDEPLEIGFVTSQIATNQGPAVLVLPELSGLSDATLAAQINVSGAILVGIAAEDLQAGDIRAVLLDASDDLPSLSFNNFLSA